MFQSLTTSEQRSYAHRHIAELFAGHAEWLCSVDQNEAYSLHRNEIEISISTDRLMLSCWTEKGTRTWRLLDWFWNGEALAFHGSRKMGAERPFIELIPRTSASSITATIRAARQARCYRLAELASALEPDTRIERASLSPGARRGQPGRYARILLRRKRYRIAVTAPVIPTRVGAVDAGSRGIRQPAVFHPNRLQLVSPQRTRHGLRHLQQRFHQSRRKREHHEQYADAEYGRGWWGH